MVAGALSLGVKRKEREVDHSPLYSAEVKNAWSYTLTPQYAFMALCSVKITGKILLIIIVTVTVINYSGSILFVGRIYYLKTDSIYTKFVGYNLKVSHRCQFRLSGVGLSSS
jgi:hypothetical protein